MIPKYLRYRLCAGLALIALGAGQGPAIAAEAIEKIPHFAALRSDDVNLRAGPGSQYPIAWVYKRKATPVEVVAKFDIWRKIRDWQGTEGWVHETMLSHQRSGVITGTTRILRRNAAPDGEPLAQLEPGVIGRLVQCQPNWCELEIQGVRGWLQRSEFWGTYPGENIE